MITIEKTIKNIWNKRSKGFVESQPRKLVKHGTMETNIRKYQEK